MASASLSAVRARPSRRACGVTAAEPSSLGFISRLPAGAWRPPCCSMSWRSARFSSAAWTRSPRRSAARMSSMEHVAHQQLAVGPAHQVAARAPSATIWGRCSCSAIARISSSLSSAEPETVLERQHRPAPFRCASGLSRRSLAPAGAQLIDLRSSRATKGRTGRFAVAGGRRGHSPRTPGLRGDGLSMRYLVGDRRRRHLHGLRRL